KAPTLPPRIVDVEPRDPDLIVDAGKPLDFTVTAEVAGPTSGGKGLSYLWSIDDRRPQRSDSGRFRFAEASPGTYQLSVTAVGPEGLQSAAKRWTVEVKAIEVARPQLPPPPPPVVPVAPAATLSQQEAMNWLETTYRQAYERRDIDALVQIGEISTEAAPRLKAVLDGYKDYRVSFKDVTVRNEGNRAIVRFTRVDTIDGKTLPIPQPKELTLEKGNGGRIARRR
ncbi:MAG TPA: PKD domain-containing protein, partial [Patescibacteria group bacterium]|nr:PKD domain-containing protein [Patescibacteria group bacterium]